MSTYNTGGPNNSYANSFAFKTHGARYYAKVGGAIPGVANTLVVTSGTSSTQNISVAIDNDRCGEEVTFSLSAQNNFPSSLSVNLTGATISAGALQSTGGTLTYDGGAIELGTYYAVLDASGCDSISEVPLLVVVE